MAPQGVVGYSLVHATVRALYADLLSARMWDRLIGAQDHDAVLALLSTTAYGPHLAIERSLLTPRRAVYQIRWRLAEVYERLIGMLRLTQPVACELMQTLWQNFEVNNLKAALRGTETRASWDQVRHLLYPMSRYISLTAEVLEQIVHATDMARAIELVQHTPYYDTLRYALHRYQDERNLFPLEVALDLGSRRRLWASIAQLSGRDREMALQVVGLALDVDNLLWAIRYRVYSHLSEEEIINYTLPLGYQVKDEHIRAIAAEADIAQVVRRAFPQLPEIAGLSPLSGKGLTSLEQQLQYHIIRTCQHMFIGYPFHLGIPLAYVLLHEYEIRDLTVLIEAKFSRLKPQAFTSLLNLQPLLPGRQN